MAIRHIDVSEATGPEDAREKRVRRDFWTVAKHAARYIPFMDEVIAAYYCALDPNTPPKPRGMLPGALIYFVVPFDLCRDMLLGVGFTDDLRCW